MRKRFCIFAIIFIFIPFQSGIKAQDAYPNWEFKINAGYNIGGTSPLPLPVEVRKIETFSPSIISPHIALESTRWFNEKWGMSVQFTLDNKGFTVRNRVKNLRTEIQMGEELFTGNFTGRNKTEVNNSYVTVPILATYRINKKWTAQMGAYFAYLHFRSFKGTAFDGYIRKGSPIGEKTEVPHATFDFSKEQNRIDYGLIAAGEWEFYKNFAVRGQISWGLRPIFPSDFTGMSFKMYNIYGTIGVSYRIKNH